MPQHHKLLHGRQVKDFRFNFKLEMANLCNFVDECGGYIRINEAASNIETPGYLTGGYPDGITCEWTIEATSGKQIEMFELNGRTEDCCDHLQV